MSGTVRAALALLLAGAVAWAWTGQPAWLVLGCGTAAAVGLVRLAVATARLPHPQAGPLPVDAIPRPRTALDGQPAKETSG